MNTSILAHRMTVAKVYKFRHKKQLFNILGVINKRKPVKFVFILVQNRY